MRSFLPLTVYCISLVSLQQLLALPAEERPDTNRLDLLNKLFDESQDKALASEVGTPDVIPSKTPSDVPKWLSGFLTSKPAAGARLASPNLAWARPAEPPRIKRRVIRSRRYAHSGSRNGHHHQHQGQLMRVGCVLGTCQVQNLSHRLYQLVGQSGREDSSPINPRSPHSYG